MEMKLHLMLLYSDGSQNFVEGLSSLPDEEHTGRPLSAAVLENVSAIQKMLIGDNLFTYRMIQKEFNVRFTPIH